MVNAIGLMSHMDENWTHILWLVKQVSKAIGYITIPEKKTCQIPFPIFTFPSYLPFKRSMPVISFVLWPLPKSKESAQNHKLQIIITGSFIMEYNLHVPEQFVKWTKLNSCQVHWSFHLLNNSWSCILIPVKRNIDISFSICLLNII